MKGVSWRGLARLASITLCVAGVAQFAMGAVVPVKATVAQLLLARAFDRSVVTHRPQKPWSWADMAVVARVSVPRLGVDRVVLDMGSGQAMAFGPTLLPGGARLGDPGTAVIAAHRDTHFRFLQYVRTGDMIDVESIDGTTRKYRVTNARIVRWDRFAIAADGPASQLALSTCYPFGAMDHGPLRYVVYASPV
ncbi:class GN sortase [soil metagenome]